MNQQLPASPPCRSVFRENAAVPAKKNYTQLWTALINQMERNKKVLSRAK